MGFEGFAPAQGLTATSIIESGSAVSGGTANGVLYVDAAGLLATEAAFTYNESTNILTVDKIANSGVLLFNGGGTSNIFGVTGSGVQVRSDATIGFSSTTSAAGSGDLFLARDAAGILHQRNSTNAQILRIANTYTSASVLEYFTIDWQATANTCILQTNHTGGSARNLQIRHGAAATSAIVVGTSIGGGLFLGTGAGGSFTGARVGISNAGTNVATSGTAQELLVDGGPAPTSTSTLVWKGVDISSNINYSAGTPGAGQIKLLHIRPTVTAAPTGLNAACVFSASASTLGGMIFHNQSDEATNYEIARALFTGNVFTLESTAAGSGTVRNINLSVANAAGSAVVAHASTSTIAGAVTDGYTSGLRLTPTYNAATALTVTRHNYIDINNTTLGGAGPAAVTDGCVFRFDAAAGTHKAVDSGTTKTSPGTVTQWIKVNVNGTIAYIPSYSSKTS